MSDKLLFDKPTWDLPLIEKIWSVIHNIATEKYGLTYYKPQIEVITANQMIYYSSLSGLPFMYNHWSFGKAYEQAHKAYTAGDQGVAYEMIINSNPMVCYIMETNSTTMQALVLAHAIVGHGSFFKNNYCFQTWTQADTILPYCKYAKKYVAECEEKYGSDAVERILDAAHALQWVGVDRLARTREKRKEELTEMKEERRKYEEQMYNEVWAKTVPKNKSKNQEEDKGYKFPWPFPEENVLYFIEKNSPHLEEWQREIVRIVRTVGQYFYPQLQCKLMHEGWASFWHYTIMTDLYDDGYINDASYLEFLASHTSVAHQPARQYYDIMVGTRSYLEEFNPYALGFEMFKKIRQVCENPTALDETEFPTIAGTPWIETMKDIMENYTDESFVYQYLSSETIEKFNMTVIEKSQDEYFNYTTFKEISDKNRLSVIRKALSEKFSISTRLPSVEVIDYNMKGDRMITLRHNPVQGMALDREAMLDTMKYLRVLWGPYPTKLKTIDEQGKTWDQTHMWSK